MSDAPKRHLTGIRPKSGGVVYAPQRDLAYLYSPALGEAIHFLSPNTLDEFHKELMGRLGRSDEPFCTTEELCAAIDAFMRAHELFTGEPQEGSRYVSPQEALEVAGFYKTKPLAQMFIYEKLGAVMTAGFFIACRDVTGYYDVPPPEVGLAEMLGEGRALCGCLTRPLLSPATVAELRTELEVTKATLEQEQKRVALKEQELKECKLTFGDMKKNALVALEDLREARVELQQIKDQPLWRKLLGLAPKG